MRINVTDLFDSLFAIAALAHRDFFDGAEGTDSDREQWASFCRNLSDTHFVPLCARRAFVLTHVAMPLADVKRRIITQVPFGPQGVLLNMWYEGPRFFCAVDQPSGFAANFHHDGDESIREFLPRPQHGLTLHFGPVPEAESVGDRPAYDENLPHSYYCKHGVETMFAGRVTKLLETRGEWLVREVTLADTVHGHEWEQPRWIERKGLQEISRDLFQQMWTLAVSNQ